MKKVVYSTVTVTIEILDVPSRKPRFLGPYFARMSENANLVCEFIKDKI